MELIFKNSMSQCTFFMREPSGKTSCKALSKTPSREVCGDCKFFKTPRQFSEGVAEAVRMLADKGLRAQIIIDDYGNKTMSAVPVEEEW